MESAADVVELKGDAVDQPADGVDWPVGRDEGSAQRVALPARAVVEKALEEILDAGKD